MLRTQRTILFAILVAGSHAACTRAPEATKDLADQVHKALEPTPEFVDQPAEKPLQPKSTE